jgi:hypothetical protein
MNKASEKVKRIRAINKQLYALGIKEGRLRAKRKELVGERTKLVASLSTQDKRLYYDSLKRAKAL